MRVEPDARCAICGAHRQLEVHHIEPRRMGGSRSPEIEADANKVVLCRTCHTQITEQRWRLTRTPDELAVTDVATGEILARRRSSATFSPGAYFQHLQSLEEGLGQLLAGIAYLGDDQLVALFSELRGLDQRTWVVQAAICWEAKQRSVYGDRAWEAMGTSFGIGWRHAYNLARVWEAFFLGREGEVCTQVQTSALQEVSWYVVAAAAENPPFWLAYSEDRKAEQPSYTISDFREEIAAAGAAACTGGAGGCAADEGGPCRIVRVYCNRSRRVIPATGCSACALVAAGGGAS